MFITKMSLPRRTFLRGVGATLALPLLDGMVPAFAIAARGRSDRTRRLAVAYVPNGIQMEQWTPAADGAASRSRRSSSRSRPFRDRMLVVTGLANRPAFPAAGEGTGDHVRASATFLTGVHPKKTEGPDIRAGVSMDQIAAQALGKDTQLTSLELCLDSNELIGACEAGYSCAYANTLSWRNPTTPLPMENQPRAVFERLFGDSDNTTQGGAPRPDPGRSQHPRFARRGSAAAAAAARAGRPRASSTQYLDAIRDIERRIQKAEEQIDVELPSMERPSGGIPSTFAEHAQADVRSPGAGVSSAT